MNCLIINTVEELKEFAMHAKNDLHFDDIYILATSSPRNEIHNSHTLIPYDSLLNDDLLKDISSNCYKAASHWYLTNDGVDFTKYENLSLGEAGYIFFHHCFATTLKYKEFLSIIKPKYDRIYYLKNDNNQLFLCLTNNLKMQNQFFLIESITKTKTIQVPTPSFNYMVDSQNTFFRNSKKNILKNILIAINNLATVLLPRNKNLTLLTQAGKTQELVDFYVENKSRYPDIQFCIPFTSLNFKHFFKIPFFLISPSCFIKKNHKRDLFRKKIENNFRINEIIPKEIILYLYDIYFGEYIGPIISYYENAKYFFKKSNISSIICSAENHISNILLAQASKDLGIKTISSPHGLTRPNLPPPFYGRSRHSLFRYALVFSECDRFRYSKRGFNINDVYVSSFFYFLKFIERRKQLHPKKGKELKILILPLDHTDFTRTNFSDYNLKQVLEICCVLNATTVTIKTRIQDQLDLLDLKGDSGCFKEMKIEKLFGYSNFIDIVGKFDLVIGPYSTSLIESNLMGIPYYLFMPDEATLGYGFESFEMDEIYYRANKPDELLQNIKNGRMFKGGKTINDLICIKKLRNPSDFFEKLYSSLKCINKN